jgi:hypothetical protein
MHLARNGTNAANPEFLKLIPMIVFRILKHTSILQCIHYLKCVKCELRREVLTQKASEIEASLVEMRRRNKELKRKLS